MHSTFSDGTYTPEELIRAGAEAGLYAMALTDHDNTAGLERFLAAAGEAGIRALPGVEVSAEHAPGGMDILGYGIDCGHALLNEKLQWILEGRNERNEEILKRLNDLGCLLTMEDVASQAGADVVGRPHSARAG